MKATNTTTIEVQKNAIEYDFIDLFRVLSFTFLVCIIAILLYKSFYWWSIGIILVSFGVAKIYSAYKELIDFDWSIDVSDFTMDDVMADLEGNSYSKCNSETNQKMLNGIGEAL